MAELTDLFGDKIINYLKDELHIKITKKDCAASRKVWYSVKRDSFVPEPYWYTSASCKIGEAWYTSGYIGHKSWYCIKVPHLVRAGSRFMCQKDTNEFDHIEITKDSGKYTLTFIVPYKEIREVDLNYNSDILKLLTDVIYDEPPSVTHTSINSVKVRLCARLDAIRV